VGRSHDAVDPMHYFHYALGDEARWDQLEGQRLVNRTLGVGTIVGVEHRDGKAPLIFIRFDSKSDSDTPSRFLPQAFGDGFFSELQVPSELAKKVRAHQQTRQDEEWVDRWRASEIEASRSAAVPGRVSSRKQAAAESMRSTLAPASTPAEVEGVCQEHRIECFYHITHLDNLCGILANGLLCHNNVKDYHDISDSEIQDRRHFKTLSQNRWVTLHDCACLFVAPMPPMLSVRRDQQAEVIYLHVDPSVLALPGVEFTDGNAASNNTRFYHKIESLGRLDWAILRARYWASDDPEKRDENKRRRSAEVLVPWCVPLSHIRGITVMTRQTYDEVSRIVREANEDIPVRIDPRMYYPSERRARESKPAGDGRPLEPPPAFEDELPF